MKIKIIFLLIFLNLTGGIHSQVPGDLDSTFALNGKETISLGTGHDYGRAICIQNDGKILIGGSALSDFALIRLENDGSLDLSFDNDGIVTTIVGIPASISSIKLQQDEKILAGGFAKVNGSYDGFVLVRYNTDGSLDNSFGAGGIVRTSFTNKNAYGRSLAIQADNKILMTGEAGGWPSDFLTVRYNTDGTLDDSFGDGGIVITDIVTALDLPKDILIQDDNKIVVAGQAEPDMCLVRYNPDGTLDSLFGTGGKIITKLGLTSQLSAIELCQNNKILGVGEYSDGGNYRIAIVRYTPNGTIDSLFGDGGITIVHSGYSDYASEIVLQQNDHIVVSGTSYIGAFYYFELIKFNEFGMVDSTFGHNGIVRTTFNQYDRCNGIALQDDGKIVAAGYTNSGEIDFAVARYYDDISLSAENHNISSSNLYPNPVRDIINIEGVELNKNTRLTLFNSIGQILFVKQLNDSKTSLDVSNLPKGIYFIQLQNDKYIEFEKVIKL